MPVPTKSPVFGVLSASKPHLVKGRPDGIGGEVAKLRKDTEAAFFDFRVPAYANADRPDPEVGRVIFNTTDHTLNVGDGTHWRNMAGTIT